MIINKVIRIQVTKFMILVTYFINNNIKAEKSIEENGRKSTVLEEKVVFDSYDDSYTISVEVISELTTNKEAVNKTDGNIKATYSKRFSSSNEVPEVTDETKQLAGDDYLFENMNVDDSNHSEIKIKNMQANDTMNIMLLNGDEETDTNIKEKEQVLITVDENTEIINSAATDDSIEEESSKENRLNASVKTWSSFDESSEKYMSDNRRNSEDTFNIDTSDIEISGRRRMLNSDVFLNIKETKAEYPSETIVPHYHSILTRNGIIYEPHLTFPTNYNNIIKNKNSPSSTEASNQINQKAIQATNNDNNQTTAEPKLLDEYIIDNSENQYPLVTSHTQKPLEIPQQTQYQQSNNFNTILFKKLVEASKHPKHNPVNSYNVENTPKYPNMYWSSNPNTETNSYLWKHLE